MLRENDEFRCRLKKLTAEELQWLNDFIEQEKGQPNALKRLVSLAMTSLDDKIKTAIDEHEKKHHKKKL